VLTGIIRTITVLAQFSVAEFNYLNKIKTQQSKQDREALKLLYP